MYATQLRWTAKPGKGPEVGAGTITFKSVFERVTGGSARAWTAVGGAPAGSFAVSARMDSMRAITAVAEQLNADDEYQALGRTLGPLVVAPAEVEISRFVGITNGFEPKPFVSLISAVTAPGQMAGAIAWASEAIQFVHDLTGAGAAVTNTATGTFGQIQLAVGYDGPDQYDEAFAKLSADPGYLALVERAGPLFEPGTGHQMVAQQIG